VTHAGRWSVAAALALLAAAPAAALGAGTTQGPATNVAKAAGLAQITQSIGSTIGDFNRDGRRDVLLNRAYKAPAGEYLNTGGRFKAVNLTTFVRNDRHGCAVADVNHNGRQDIYCAVGASHGVDIKSNELWMQQRGGGFVNRAAKYHVADPDGRSRGAVFFDANNDGWPDLFVSNYYPRPDGLPTPNKFYLNDHGTGFVAAPGYDLNKTVGGLALAPGCQQAGDYNDDGFPDLLVCGKAGIHLYRNNGGRSFTDVTAAVGLSGVWYGARMVDLNGDGRLDLVMVNRTRLQVRLQQPDGEFGVVSIAKGLTAGRAVATGDVNGDGYPDIYVLQGATGPHQVANPPDIMYLNDGGTALTKVPIPETSRGNGAAVSPIDYNNDGTTDFLVTNGARGLAGPVQLISFPPP
jgi:FG-GAP-like repeat/FG-GAP repeat